MATFHWRFAKSLQCWVFLSLLLTTAPAFVIHFGFRKLSRPFVMILKMPSVSLISVKQISSVSLPAVINMMQTNVDMPLLKTLARPREPMVLAVVMDTRGSTPVKDGSMMAIGKLGPIAGTIGGGCGEAEITQIARKMLGTGEKKVVSVNMTNDIAGDEGMVCGGIMHVLLEEVEYGDFAAENHCS